MVRFEALPNRTWELEVKSISPMIDATTGVGLVRLAFRPGATLPPIGLSGEVKVEVGSISDALTVPSTALRGSSTGGVEVLTCEAGHLHAIAVEVGARSKDQVQVLSGLTAGQEVVPTEVLGLQDGAAIEARP